MQWNPPWIETSDIEAQELRFTTVADHRVPDLLAHLSPCAVGFNLDKFQTVTQSWLAAEAVGLRAEVDFASILSHQLDGQTHGI